MAWTICTLVAALGAAGAPRGADGPQTDEVQQLDEQVAQLRHNLEGFCINLEVEYRYVRVQRTEGKEQTKKGDGRFRLNGHLREVSSFGDSGTKSIRVYNGRYAFFMGRSRGRRRDELFRYDPSSEKGAEIVQEVDYEVSKTLQSALMVVDYSIDEMLASPDRYDFVGLRPLHRSGRNLFKVTLERRDDGKRFPCGAVLDPANHWAIIESFMKWPWGEERRIVEYNPGIAEVPFPLSIDYVMDAPDYNAFTEHRIFFETPGKCLATADQFTLQAYGLPEIGRGRPYVRIVLVAAGLILLIVIGAVLFAKERAQGSRGA